MPSRLCAADEFPVDRLPGVVDKSVDNFIWNGDQRVAVSGRKLRYSILILTQVLVRDEVCNVELHILHCRQHLKVVDGKALAIVREVSGDDEFRCDFLAQQFEFSSRDEREVVDDQVALIPARRFHLRQRDFCCDHQVRLVE